MTIEHISIPVTNGEQPLATIVPERDASVPYLLVVPSIFGIADDLLAQMTELSDEAAVVALDPFWRVEPGPIDYADFQGAIERMGQLDRQACFDDWLATIAWVRRQPRCNGRVVALGICFGGPFCLLAAADGLVDGVVTWHGSSMENFVERAAEMRCPMVHHVGAADQFVPAEAIEKLRTAFASHDNVDIVLHDGADHGFSHAGPAFLKSAERAGMASVRELLRGGAWPARQPRLRF